MKHVKKQMKLSNMNKFHIKILPLVIFFLIPFFPDNKVEVVSKNEMEQTISNLDKIIQDEMIYGNLVGLAVSVVKDGKIIHQKSYGFTDLEKKTPFTNSTLFRWASISKVITAVAVHQLKEDNKLKLDDKVSDKVSNWPKDGNKKDITIKHLLSHRSGIINYYGDYNKGIYKGSKTAAFIPSQSVDVFKSANLDSVPGTKHQYSSFAYNLLGEVVHNVGGGWDNHINTRIKNKLGLSSLTYNSTNGIKGYDKLCDDILVNRDGSDVIWKVPGGGYLSNIVDLNKFMMGLMNGTLLKSTAGLWNENISGNNGYSLGMKRVNLGGVVFAEHGGAHADMRTKLILNPNKKDGIVIAINGGNYANWTMGKIIHKIANEVGIYSANQNNNPYHYSYSKNDTEDDVEDGEALEEPCKGENVAIWHAADDHVILRRGYSHNAFGDEWQRLRSAGYVCINFETYTLNNKQVWDGIFKKQTGAQAMWRNFESADFNKKWQEMSDQGYRLVDLETYMVGSKRLYAGLFLPGKGKYALFRGLSTADFGTKREELGKSGYKLIDLEVYYENGQQKWCGVWIEGQDGMLNRNYTTADFQKLVDTRKKEGWNMIDLETYMDGRTRKWAGVWEKSTQNQETLFGYKHDGLFSQKLNTNINNRMVLTDIERY
jgi:CubicO group peptidase (beta-lactamase class C family)